MAKKLSEQLHIHVPKSAKKDEIVLVRIKFDHPMNGAWDVPGHPMEAQVQMLDEPAPVSADPVREVVCSYNGKTVFKAHLDVGISANPYIAFNIRARESGRVTSEWITASGEKYATSTELNVVT